MTIQERAAKVLQQIDAALARWDAEVLCGKGSFSTINPQSTVPHHYVSFGGRHVADVIGESNAAFIAASRTLLPTSLCCLKTAIEGLLPVVPQVENHHPDDLDRGRCPHCLALAGASVALITLCYQWEAEQ